jgi:hypothetical protein
VFRQVSPVPVYPVLGIFKRKTEFRKNSWAQCIVSYIPILDYTQRYRLNSISISRINQKKYLLDNSNFKKFHLFFVFVVNQRYSTNPNNFYEKFSRVSASTRRPPYTPYWRVVLPSVRKHKKLPSQSIYFPVDSPS